MSEADSKGRNPTVREGAYRRSGRSRVSPGKLWIRLNPAPSLTVGLLTPQETSSTRLASQKPPKLMGLTVLSREAYSSLTTNSVSSL